jgi:RHS repeat-associated protein
MEDNGVEDEEDPFANPRIEEMQYFENLFETEVDDAHMNVTPASAKVTNPDKASYLFWNDTPGTTKEEKAIGPSIALKVNKGDKIDVSVWARYEEKLSYARDFNLTALSGLLGSTFVSQTGFEGYSTTQTSSTLLGALTAAAFGTDTDNTRPYAYLNYVILDNALGYRNGDAERVPETAGSEPAELYLAANKPVKFGFGEEIVVEEDGYIYIWVSNESQSTRVWFDDLTVTHDQNLVVQASDYGVWGDVLREQRTDDKKYRFGYQGQFAEKDEETGWNHFELREYDPTIGRWTAVDPKRIGWSPYIGMFNNPVSGTDPDGGGPNDYYQNEAGEIVFRNSSEATLCENGETLTNIGTSYASFDGTSLNLHYQVQDACGDLIAKTFSTPAVSGRPNDMGLFDYSFESQKNKGSGPLPEGNYTIDIANLRELTFTDDVIGTGLSWTQTVGKKFGGFPGGNYSWGFGRIPINPTSVVIDGVTRTGFTIHGGAKAGSAGCIDLMRGETLFFSKMKQFTEGPVLLNVEYNGLKLMSNPFNSNGTGFK